MSHQEVIIRATTQSDGDALASLSRITARRYRSGRGLVAVLDGEPIAAISLTSGGVVADVDRAHPATVRSLRRRRYQILRQGGDVGRARNVLRRLAPAIA
jgi:hypothetical protein